MQTLQQARQLPLQQLVALLLDQLKVWVTLLAELLMAMRQPAQPLLLRHPQRALAHWAVKVNRIVDYYCRSRHCHCHCHWHCCCSLELEPARTRMTKQRPTCAEEQAEQRKPARGQRQKLEDEQRRKRSHRAESEHRLARAAQRVDSSSAATSSVRSATRTGTRPPRASCE